METRRARSLAPAYVLNRSAIDRCVETTRVDGRDLIFPVNLSNHRQCHPASLDARRLESVSMERTPQKPSEENYREKNQAEVAVHLRYVASHATFSG